MRSDTIFINKNENKVICIHENCPCMQDTQYKLRTQIKNFRNVFSFV